MEAISKKTEIIIKALSMKPASFAKSLNVSASVIYNIVKGNNAPSYGLLSKIVHRYNVNPLYLFYDNVEIFNGQIDIPQPIIPRFIKKVIEKTSDTTINDRIGILIDDLGMNPKLFADKLGYNPNVIYNTLKLKSKPGYDVINNIIETFNVDADWLICGNSDNHFKSDEGDLLSELVTIRLLLENKL